MIERWFFAHPRSVGESYAEHAAVAGRFGLALVVAGLACLVHAVVPALFVRTASDAVRRLHAGLGSRRERAADTSANGAAAREWQLTYEI